MTTPERVHALCQAVRYVVSNGIPGDVVECGVWRGGSMMAAARTLMEESDTSRDLHLFDTFEGMVAPGPNDSFGDAPAVDVFDRQIRAAKDSAWCNASLPEVRAAMARTGYPEDHIKYVPGRVEHTLPAAAPKRLSILRLDTDWYESTLHELVCLFPRLQPGGVLIIDDYGHWKGARQAVDEYFATLDPTPMLTRIDYSARIAVIPGWPVSIAKNTPSKRSVTENSCVD